MNIRDWPMDRILQLPDHCFGRRWLVSCTCRTPDGAVVWDISELSLPEHIIVWEFVAWCPVVITEPVRFRLGLGDRLPTTVEQMDVLEPLFIGLGVQGASPRSIYLPLYSDIRIDRLRCNVHTGGRRVVLELDTDAAAGKGITIGLVVSSFPTAVPDCYA